MTTSRGRWVRGNSGHPSPRRAANCHKSLSVAHSEARIEKLRKIRRFTLQGIK